MWVQFEKKTWRNLIFTGVNSRRFDLGLSLNNFIVAEVLTSDQPDSLGNEDSNVEAVMMLNTGTGNHFDTYQSHLCGSEHICTLGNNFVTNIYV